MCGRVIWEEDELGTDCLMRQPNGTNCEGEFVSYKDLAPLKAYLNFNKGQGHSFTTFKAGYEAGVKSGYYAK